jgi:hypothetical protein
VIALAPGCDRAWREALTPWQERALAALYRRGRGLADRTDHGSDKRWSQAGVKTRDRYGTWRRTRRSDTHAHERVIIRPTEYGFDALFVRRDTAYTVDPDTGDITELPDAWTVVGRDKVGRNMTIISGPLPSRTDERFWGTLASSEV